MEVRRDKKVIDEGEGEGEKTKEPITPVLGYMNTGTKMTLNETLDGASGDEAEVDSGNTGDRDRGRSIHFEVR